MASPDQLLILLKAPVLGLVKTRLAAQSSDVFALDVYQQLAQRLFTNLSRFNTVQLHFTPSSGRSLIEAWLRPAWTAHLQGEGDLGQRMQAAFSAAFSTGAERVIMVGADCPDIITADIESAWASLHHHDLVLGPANDGGYWLIGLKKVYPELFNGIQWSTSHVLADTLAIAQQLGFRVHRLRTLTDIDTLEDWTAYQQRISALE